MAAAAAVAVVAVAVPVSLSAFGGSSTGSRTAAVASSGRQTPSQAPSPVSLEPSPSALAGSAGPPPTSAAASQPWPPPLPKLALPNGPAPTLPLLIDDSATHRLSLQDKGKTFDLGPSPAGISRTAATPYGIVLSSADMLQLVTPDHHLVTLMSQTGLQSGTVSSDGRYVAWSAVLDPTGMIPVSTRMGLFDLRSRKTLDESTLSWAGYVTGFLDDGRVTLKAISNDAHGGKYAAMLWNPATGKTTSFGGTSRNATVVDGHTVLVSNGCRTYLQDMRNGHQTPLADCVLQVVAGPSDRRLLGWDGGQVAIVDAATGSADTRIATLLRPLGLQVDEAAWVDDTHVLLRTVGGTTAAQPTLPAWAPLIGCSVPVTGKPSCWVSQQIGPSRIVGDASGGGRLTGPRAEIITTDGTGPYDDGGD